MNLKSKDPNPSIIDNNLKSLRILSAICIIAGNWSLIFEIYYFHDWSPRTYFARVLFTLIASGIFLFSYRIIQLKKINLLIHLLIISLIGSFAFTMYKLPNTLYINSQILSLLIFTTAIVFSWEIKNQIIVAIYYNIMFAGSMFLIGERMFYLPNIFSLIIFVSLISILSIAASAINYKLREIYRIKVEEINFLFNSVPLGICRTDMHGNVLTANKFLMQLLKIEETPKDFKLYDYIKNESLQSLFNRNTNEIVEKMEYEIEFERENEKFKYLNIISDVISDNQFNKSLGFIVEDKTDYIISQRKREKVNKILYDEIIKKEENARIALTEKNQKIQLLAKINHEVITPLNSILMFHDMLDEDILKSLDEVKKYSKIVKTSVSDLLNTINNFIDFAKIETGKLVVDIELFNIKEEIEDIIQLLCPLALRKKVDLILSIQDTSENLAYSDGKKYRQILINLIANSIKFTNAGSIKVDLNNKHLINDQYEIITIIEDTGIGIPQDKLHSIFDPFVSLHEGDNIQSSGLGLAICKEFVQMLNGKLIVESTVGNGTKFTLTIPYCYDYGGTRKVQKT